MIKKGPGYKKYHDGMWDFDIAMDMYFSFHIVKPLPSNHVKYEMLKVILPTLQRSASLVPFVPLPPHPPHLLPSVAPRRWVYATLAHAQSFSTTIGVHPSNSIPINPPISPSTCTCQLPAHCIRAVTQC